MPRLATSIAEILYCPPAEAGGLASEIRNRGNVPVCFGHSSIVELTPADIRENWQTTKSLRRQVAGAMAAELGQRLWRSTAIDEDDDADHAGEAAACLFLALHHEAVPLRQALAGCRIFWDQRNHSEKVECCAGL
jgi:hypothetical protein